MSLRFAVCFLHSTLLFHVHSYPLISDLDLNAQMRRIDLICKLAGPFFISLIDGVSTEAAIIVNVSMNLASVLVDNYAIARVCRNSGVYYLHC